jgi:TatA/E family protein of Tat protein translocase
VAYVRRLLMPGLDHLPELLVICVVALLVFGPTRMIQMGSRLGRAVRELRESTKDLNWTALLGGSEPSKPSSTSLGALSQFTQSLSNGLRDLQASPTSASEAVTPPTSQPAVESFPIVGGEHQDGEAVTPPEEKSGIAE